MLRADLCFGVRDDLTVLVTAVRKGAGRGGRGRPFPRGPTPACALNERAVTHRAPGRGRRPGAWGRAAGRVAPGRSPAPGGLCRPFWEMTRTHTRSCSQNTATSAPGPRSQTIGEAGRQRGPGRGPGRPGPRRSGRSRHRAQGPRGLGGRVPWAADTARGGALTSTGRRDAG